MTAKPIDLDQHRGMAAQLRPSYFLWPALLRRRYLLQTRHQQRVQIQASTIGTTTVARRFKTLPMIRPARWFAVREKVPSAPPMGHLMRVQQP